MKIAFYAPFKPLGHKNPSGDLAIAHGLVSFLESRGHVVSIQSRLRARWIYFKPRLWPHLFRDLVRSLRRLRKDRPDLWLTYHTYYKAPDVLGPVICRILGLKYILFQGIYSTKRKRRFKSIFGFYLNRMALNRADHVFTNKLSDLKNLKRIIAPERLSYIRPGIRPLNFKGDESAGTAWKKQWNLPPCPVILTAAMFRDDVKTRSLAWLIQCLSLLVNQNIPFHLVIAGAGKMEGRLRRLAQQLLPNHHTFAGKIPKNKMAGFYSSGDLFAFPGIRESLGMVFLEAQSCGLPIVAFDNGGIPEVMKNRETGFLVPMYDEQAFCRALILLLSHPEVCKTMGARAEKYVEKNHDLYKNYQLFEEKMIRAVVK
ncbi:glycosyltransferase family 4 protein [Desulfospira joergensenii]|uniref:glycosyltransferase family 4 protein n=1 Tax=Desulfospira joergensenii TaxID=53329 RepID=UPI0003B59131|nr:glycosyltransferase family 4 protein [Desulfospira joergensenii]